MMKTRCLISGAAVLLLCGPTLCAVSILISPDRQQFLQFQSVTLSCSTDGLSVDGWPKVMRTVRGETQTCGPDPAGFWRLVGSSCETSDLRESDSADYWCQTRDGQKSDVVSIFVSAALILEIPALPVVAGSDVTLRCVGRGGSSLVADFFKDGVPVGSGPGSGFTITGVKVSDEGLYACSVALSGESAQSNLRVKGAAVLLLCGPTLCAVSILISPDRQQFLQFQSVTLSCSTDGLSVDGWPKVMRTVRGETQTCGPDPAGFWRLVGSSCETSDLRESDSADYWCQTRDGQKSDVVSIFVAATLILEIPALPVVAGSDVTLRCVGEGGSSLIADFLKDGVPVGSGPGSGFTITGVKESDEGLYACSVALSGESAQSKLRVKGAAVLLLCGPTLCAVSILISPDRQQFLQFQSVTLSCSTDGLSVDGWPKVMRTVRGETQTCGPDPAGFWRLVGSSCETSDLRESDSADYWCQTRDGQKSDVVSIIVSAALILEIPALPVVAGSDVTLRCVGRGGSSLIADFFKDGVTVGSGPGSGFTITGVKVSDEGLYACSAALSGESYQSKLRVKAPAPWSPASPPPPSGVPLVIVAPVCSLVLLLLMLLSGELLLLWTKQRGK